MAHESLKIYYREESEDIIKREMLMPHFKLEKVLMFYGAIDKNGSVVCELPVLEVIGTSGLTKIIKRDKYADLKYEQSMLPKGTGSRITFVPHTYTMLTDAYWRITQGEAEKNINLKKLIPKEKIIFQLKEIRKGFLKGVKDVVNLKTNQAEVLRKIDLRIREAEGSKEKELPTIDSLKEFF